MFESKFGRKQFLVKVLAKELGTKNSYLYSYCFVAMHGYKYLKNVLEGERGCVEAAEMNQACK